MIKLSTQLPESFKLALRGLLRVLIDFPTRSQPASYSFYELFRETCRYRLAAFGMPLSDNEKQLLALKSLHKGKRCFLLGNGPSLNMLDLRKLKNELTFGVNAIYLNYDKMGFYPTYYVVEDVFVAEDRAEEIRRYRKSVKLYGNHLKYCLGKDDNTLLINNIIDFNEDVNFPHFSMNALRRVWSCGTVTYICLQLAYYLGFQEVYMIGFDHSYTIPDNAIVDGNDITSVSDDPNHFNPDYFGKGKRWHDPRVDRMEKGYRKAKQYFEADGRKIYNATAGGKLEVFDRVDFNSLF